ncbi:MAG: hypothetical protein L0Z55_08845 [Planctomycetes bacterium]|nr:hypothetical protein [Planctomycetota bacterium]
MIRIDGTNGARNEKDARRGSILILAILMMTAGILYGLGYLSVAAAGIDVQEGALARLKACAIAEGGLDQTLLALMDGEVPVTGAMVTLGGGSYMAEVVPSGGGYDVEVVGSCDGVQMFAAARVETINSVLDLKDTFLVRGSVSGRVHPAFQWGGTLAYGNLNSLISTAGNGKMIAAGSYSNLAIDPAAYAATDTLAGDSVMRAGSYEGHYHCLGNLTIDASPTLLNLSGGVSVIGSILVEGKLTIEGGGRDVQLLAGARPVILLVEGDLMVDNVDTLKLNGSSIIQGSAQFLNGVAIGATGSIALNGDLFLDDVSGGPWQYDSGIRKFPPAEVSGGPRRSELDERWRRIGGSGILP